MSRPGDTNSLKRQRSRGRGRAKRRHQPSWPNRPEDSRSNTSDEKDAKLIVAPYPSAGVFETTKTSKHDEIDNTLQAFVDPANNVANLKKHCEDAKQLKTENKSVKSLQCARSTKDIQVEVELIQKNQEAVQEATTKSVVNATKSQNSAEYPGSKELETAAEAKNSDSMRFNSKLEMIKSENKGFEAKEMEELLGAKKSDKIKNVVNEEKTQIKNLIIPDQDWEKNEYGFDSDEYEDCITYNIKGITPMEFLKISEQYEDKKNTDSMNIEPKDVAKGLDTENTKTKVILKHPDTSEVKEKVEAIKAIATEIIVKVDTVKSAEIKEKVKTMKSDMKEIKAQTDKIQAIKAIKTDIESKVKTMKSDTKEIKAQTDKILDSKKEKAQVESRETKKSVLPDTIDVEVKANVCHDQKNVTSTFITDCSIGDCVNSNQERLAAQTDVVYAAQTDVGSNRIDLLPSTRSKVKVTSDNEAIFSKEICEVILPKEAEEKIESSEAPEGHTVRNQKLGSSKQGSRDIDNKPHGHETASETSDNTASSEARKEITKKHVERDSIKGCNKDQRITESKGISEVQEETKKHLIVPKALQDVTASADNIFKTTQTETKSKEMLELYQKIDTKLLPLLLEVVNAIKDICQPK